MTNKFQGKTYNNLLSWWYSWSKEARLCNLLSLSEDEFSCLHLILNMPLAYRTELMTTNTRPTFAQAIDFIDRHTQVKTICKNTDKVKMKKSNSGSLKNSVQ